MTMSNCLFEIHSHLHFNETIGRMTVRRRTADADGRDVKEEMAD